MRVSRRAERRVREHLQAQGYYVLRTRPTDLADFVALKRAGEGRTAVTLVRVAKARPAKREVARLLREALAQEPAWLDGEREEEPMSKAMADDPTQCIRCGSPGQPESSGHGLKWTIALCDGCTRYVAAKWLRRMVPKLLRDKLET